MFVAIEGINGVGKSSIVSLLESDLGFFHYAPASWLSSAMRSMDRSEDVDARHLLIMSAMMHASCRIRDLVQSGRKVVVSGYYKRTDIYHRVMGSQLSLSIDAILFQPTITILLDCCESERRERIRRRGRKRELWDDLADERIEQLRQQYAQLRWPTVDTTYLSVAATFKEVQRLIHGSFPPSGRDSRG